MKKRNIIILMSLFVFALMITLTSCSDAYSGNYQEVTTKEELKSIEEKLDALPDEDETTTKYETYLKAEFKMISAAVSTTGSVKTTTISDMANKKSYSSTVMKVGASGESTGSINLSSEVWMDYNKDALSFVNYSMSLDAYGRKQETSGKYKTKTGYMDDLMDRLGVSEYQEMYNFYDDDLDLESFKNAIEQAGAKVYVDNNKIKVEYKYDELTATMYLVINEDKTYQMKLEIPYSTYKVGTIEYKVELEMELKPTKSEISFPNPDSYKEM